MMGSVDLPPQPRVTRVTPVPESVCSPNLPPGRRPVAETGERAATARDMALASPSPRLIGETEDFPGILESFIRRPRVIGGFVHDARIAAICVAHGAEPLLTRDRDFSLFPELRTRDPIGA